MPASLVPYPPELKAAALVAHLSTAALCLGAWTRTVAPSPPPLAGHYLPRLLRGLVGSAYGVLAPHRPSGSLDDPNFSVGRDGRSEFALAAALFAWFTVLPVIVPFPAATVPTILGKRMAR